MSEEGEEAIDLEQPIMFVYMHIGTVFAISFNFFSIYVIVEKSPRQMKLYSRYLLVYQIVIVVSDLIYMFLVSPWFALPVVGFIPTGVLSQMGVSTGLQAVLIFFAILCTVSAIGELFFHRQQSILPEKSMLKLNKWQVKCWHAMVASIPIASFVLPAIMLQYNEGDRTKFIDRYPMLAPIVLREDFWSMDYFFYAYVTGGLTFLLVFCVSLLFIMVGSSIYYLYKTDVQISKRTRDLQKSFFKKLLVQTMVPLVFIFTPISVGFFIVFKHRWDLLGLNPWIIFMLSMHGPCSTFLILVLYAPYLDYVKELMGCRKKSVFAISFNFFSIYIIVEKSPRQMKLYSKYLLFYQLVIIATDLTYMFLVAPWFSLPVVGFIPTGPLTSLGVSTGLQAVLLFLAIICTVAAIGELFFHRQQCILPQKSILKLNHWQVKCWHGLIASVPLVAFAFPAYLLQYNECDRAMFSDRYPMLAPIVRHDDFWCMDHYFYSYGSKGLTFVLGFCVSLLFIMVSSSIYYLYKTDVQISKRTRDLQKSFFKKLLIQTVLPLIFIFTPISVGFFMVYNQQWKLFGLNPWIIFMLSMHGPCSTLLILVLYAPYLNYVKELVGCRKKNDSSLKTKVTILQPAPTSRLSIGN